MSSSRANNYLQVSSYIFDTKLKIWVRLGYDSIQYNGGDETELHIANIDHALILAFFLQNCACTAPQNTTTLLLPSETEGRNKMGSDKSESAISDSSNFAIRVQNVSKCYQIYEALRDRLKQFFLPRLRPLAGQQSQLYFREFWALKDISLEVRKGETVGIIDRNGSGKSTLLQIICDTLSATGKTVETKSRIAALLKLGRLQSRVYGA